MTIKELKSFNEMRKERAVFIMNLYRKHYHEYHTEQGILKYIKICLWEDFTHKKLAKIGTRTISRIIENQLEGNK